MKCVFCEETIEEALGASKICEDCLLVHTGFELHEIPEEVRELIDDVEKVGTTFFARQIKMLTSKKTTLKKKAAVPRFDVKKDLYPKIAETGPVAYYHSSEPLAQSAHYGKVRSGAERLGAACPLPPLPASVSNMKIIIPGRKGILHDSIIRAWTDSIGETLPTETVQMMGGGDGKTIQVTERMVEAVEETWKTIVASLNNYMNSTVITFKDEGKETIIEILKGSGGYYRSDNLQFIVENLMMLLALPKARDYCGILEIQLTPKKTPTRKTTPRGRKPSKKAW